MRNMQPANRVTPRPQPSPVTPHPVSTHPKRRCQTRGQQNSTEPYRILQNPTETRVCACAHARVVFLLPSFPHTPPVIPAKAGILVPLACNKWSSHVIPTHSHVIPAKAGILVPLACNKWSSHVIPTHSHVIPAKAGILVPARAGDVPFSRHGMRPGRNRFDALLGAAVPEPSCQ